MTALTASTQKPSASQSGSTTVKQALRAKFPPREVPASWPASLESKDRILQRLTEPPLRPANTPTLHARRRGARDLLTWLEQFPGESWQQRWLASGAGDRKQAWILEQVSRSLPPDTTTQTIRSQDLSSGLLALLCADVIRPSFATLTARRSRHLREAVAGSRDPEGFARLKQLAPPDLWSSTVGTMARNLIALIMLSKGGMVADITVGDCIELRSVVNKTQSRGRHASLFYSWLRELGVFPPDAPNTLRRMHVYAGQRTPAELVDRYGLKCQPIRDLIVDYLTERQPALDYTSLEDLSRTLARTFWADLERHHPGIDSLALDTEVAAAWKQRVQTKVVRRKQSDGTFRETAIERISAVPEMQKVRSFYLDITQWAIEDPARWGPWAARCPIGDIAAGYKKHRSQQKARSDARTRARLPVLPQLVATAERRLKQARARLEAVHAASAGESFTVLGETFVKCSTGLRTDKNTSMMVRDPRGRRHDLFLAEQRAFWAWACIEFLRHTGVRVEEMLETSHHSLIQYTLPSTREVVPLLQIMPSKTDEERVILVSPELADVLSAIVTRVRDPRTGRIPMVTAYDGAEKTWNQPLPLLFQWILNGQPQPISPNTIRKCLNETLEDSGLTNAEGEPLRYWPHDFRRIFVTDTIMSGLPPHIAQIICGHKSLATTMHYKALYPEEAIEAHRAFLARRRAQRPSEEYRTPTSEEWDAFLGHFERRKLSVGTCGRAFGTSCVHEHACVRCSLLRPDPAQLPRLEEIRDNLIARIAEAEREGWLGEVEGLKTSLAGAHHKVRQLDAERARAQRAIDLGMPSFSQISPRTSTATLVPTDRRR